MSNIESPISLSEIESVLSWVDGFKLSRPTKKINRDFSDAVLLAEILSVHYPKLVEMHNYPPRNSHSLKLNNWMTLNRKVLKKLKLNLCCNTMEQLANCAPGVIERVLVMVRDKIRRDDDANKGKDSDQNLSSGGSYYEACGEDDHVLLVPVKTRVNGVLETIQQKVVSYDSYLSLKEELKDAKETSDVLKQKMEHLDSLLKLKEERIDELQKQLERKQVRRKEAEAFVNSLAEPFETIPSPTQITIDNPLYTKNEALHTNNEEMTNGVKTPSVKSAEKINTTETNTTETIKSELLIPIVKAASLKSVEVIKVKSEESKIPIKIDSTIKIQHKKSDAAVNELDNLDRIKSDVFKEIEIVDDNVYVQDADDFKDTVTTIEDTIQKEVKMISDPMEFAQHLNC